MGKLKESFYRQAVEHYSRRLKAYARLETIELAEGKETGRDAFALAALLQEEEQRIDKYLRREAHCIVLTPEGRTLSTEELAAYLEKLRHTCPRLDFVLGGASGLAPGLKERSDLNLSLSRLTFPHRLARLILLEQLYRCFKLMQGEPYHK